MKNKIKAPFSYRDKKNRQRKGDLRYDKRTMEGEREYIRIPSKYTFVYDGRNHFFVLGLLSSNLVKTEKIFGIHKKKKAPRKPFFLFSLSFFSSPFLRVLLRFMIPRERENRKRARWFKAPTYLTAIINYSLQLSTFGRWDSERVDISLDLV